MKQRLSDSFWSVLDGPGVPAPVRATCTGAAIGAAFGMLIEWSGHSAVAIALLAICSVVSAYIGLIHQPAEGILLELSRWVHRRGAWVRYVLAFLLVGSSLLLYGGYGHSAANFDYLPIVPAVLFTAAFLGFRPGLVAAGLGIVGIDLTSGAPLWHVSIPIWRLILEIVLCSVLGAVLALGLFFVLEIYDDTVGD